MNTLTVCLEHRFYRCGAKTYTKLSFPYSYWKDYLQFFAEVVVIARVQAVTTLEKGMTEVDGIGVTVRPVPYYLGPRQFLKSLPSLFLALWDVARSHEKFLLRSGNVSNLLWVFLMVLRKSYLREYPGNIKNGIVGFAGNSLRIRVLAGVLDALAKIQAKYARANSFVSEDCQRIYGSSRPSYVFSSFLANEVSVRKSSYEIKDEFATIVSVGRLEGEKGHACLIEAIQMIKSRCRVKLRLIGDGGRREELRSFAEKSCLDVEFLGAITNREKLFSIVASSDLFVIPSYTEGMPRALLEAMAIGLPCVGSRGGGIPEVLPDDVLFPAGGVSELSQLLLQFLEDRELRVRRGKENMACVANRYSEKIMRKKKFDFWSHVNE